MKRLLIEEVDDDEFYYCMCCERIDIGKVWKDRDGKCVNCDSYAFIRYDVEGEENNTSAENFRAQKNRANLN